MIEVASGQKMDKAAQIQRLAQDARVNPTGKPVIVVGFQWSDKQIELAKAAAATYVVRNTIELKALLRSLGENP